MEVQKCKQICLIFRTKINLGKELAFKSKSTFMSRMHAYCAYISWKYVKKLCTFCNCEFLFRSF
jgi:coproporphyrinogen III oxidase-like Fe-S oxidoreductase